jgi:hypothetical protein
MIMPAGATVLVLKGPAVDGAMSTKSYPLSVANAEKVTPRRYPAGGCTAV